MCSSVFSVFSLAIKIYFGLFLLHEDGPYPFEVKVKPFSTKIKHKEASTAVYKL